MRLDELETFWATYDPQALGNEQAYEETAQYIADALNGTSNDDLTTLLTNAGNALGVAEFNTLVGVGLDKAGVIPDH